MELTREIRDKRIAITKDVLKQLGRQDVPLTVACGNGYVVGNLELEISPFDEIQPHVDAIQGRCDVCAKGALLLSKARLFDDVKAAAIINFSREKVRGFTRVHGDNEMITESLADVFDWLTLDRLEAAFEKTDGLAGATIDRSLTNEEEALLEAAANFGHRTAPSDPVARVRACMQILIDNDGEFLVPTTAPVAEGSSL